MRYWRRYILAILCGAFLAAFLIMPIVLAVRQGFVDPNGQWTLGGLRHEFTSGPYRRSLLNCVKVASAVTACALLVSLPLALIGHHYDFRGKRLASALLMLPLILPPFVGAIAIEKLLAAEGGPVNLLLERMGLPMVDWRGDGGFGLVVLLEVLHLYPIMFLNAAAALGNVDPTMVEASRNLGASRWRTFWKVTFPLMKPGLFAGGTIVFIWSFCEMGTPLMIGYDVLPVKIFNGIRAQGAHGKPAMETFAMVFVLLAASTGMYGIGKLLFGRSGGAAGGRGIGATERRPGRWATVLIWGAFGLVTLVAVVPHIGVILLAVSSPGDWDMTILPTGLTLKHVTEVFTDDGTWNSIANSLRYASMATVVDIVLGLLIAYLVVRLKVRGRSLLDAMSMLPLAVPGLIIAGGYVVLTRKGGLLESIGPWRDPTLILVIAYSVRRLPYVVRSISAGLQQTPESFEEAARSLGASPARAAMRITVPLISANILAGAVLAFSFAMLEVSDSLILAQTSQYFPITKQIYQLQDTPNAAAALGTFGMLLLTATLVLANLLLGKRLGALFRV